MKRKISITLIVVFIITCSVSAFAGKTIKELQKEQNEIKDNQKKVEGSLNETVEDKNTIFGELAELDETLSVLEDDIEKTSDQLDQTTASLIKTEGELVEAEKSKDEQYETLKKRIRYLHENGNVGYLEVLLHSGNFKDMLNRFEYINDIAEYDQNMFENLQQQELTIADKKNQIEIRKIEIEVLAEKQQEQKSTLLDTQRKKQEILEDLRKDEQKYQMQLKELEEADAEIEQLIKKAQEEAARIAAERAARLAAQRAAEKAAKLSTSSYESFNYTGGALLWPVPGRGRVSSDYGYRVGPFSGKREFHTGIDIPAPTGSSIVASADGIVISSGSKGGYGNTVIIDHGSGLSTLYAHNSKLLVSSGDTVTRGQVIAKAGSTGNSTGPHCHFEVRKNGSHVNPNSYLK